MDIRCPACGKTFNIDVEKAQKTPKVRCECGSVINTASSPHDSQQVPAKIGSYDVIRRIGMGGMGEVLLARHAGAAGFERQVCIKKMLPHLSKDASFISQLIREAKLTVQLSHPNIVQVYDLGQAGNEYFIAMEYVDGIDLGHLIQSAQEQNIILPVEVVVYIIIQVLRGLYYAHTLTAADGSPMNLIHRDMTPQNVLLSAKGMVKITDFGIAKAAGQISSTSPGMVKGKLGYFSPEQISGQHIDHRVDIFATGILIWESLALKRLFKAVDMVDSFRLIAQCKVPPLSEIRSDIPEALQQVIAKALQADPNQRFGSAADFALELERAMPLAIIEMEEATQAFFGTHAEFFATEASSDYQAEDTATLAQVPREKSDSFPPLSSILQHNDRPTIDLGAQHVATIQTPAQGSAVGEFAGAPATMPAKRRSPLLVVLILAVFSIGVAGGLYAAGIIPTHLFSSNVPAGDTPDIPVKPTPKDPKVPPTTVVSKPQDKPPVGKRPIRKPPVRKPPTKKTLTPADIKKGMMGSQRALSACVQRHADTVKGGKVSIKAQLTIAAGRVKKLKLLGPTNRGTAIGKCAFRVIKRISFPVHHGDPVSIIVPMEFSSVQ